MLEGEYDYEEVKDRGNPVYQRHNNCACEVTYEPGNGRVQDVHSKQWMDEDSQQKRKEWAKKEKRQYATHSSQRKENLEKGFFNATSEPQERQRGYSYQLHPGDVSVNTPEWYIESAEWESRFNSIAISNEARESVVEFSKRAVLDNKNASTESMYLIDAKDGSKIASIDQPEEKHYGFVQYTDEFKEALNDAQKKQTSIIAIHNHPNGLPPSVDDFRKAYENGYELGISPGNNGQVYSYSNSSVELDLDLCEEIHSQISELLELGVDPDEAFGSIYRLYGLSYNTHEEVSVSV